MSEISQSSVERLAPEVFADIVTHTPLVSIDLVVEDAEGRVLVGLRRNRPAAGTWFVPGGRILKNETLDVAFLRLTEAELGQSLSRAQGEFLGVYEHLYPDSALDPSVTTHYVVLAYRLGLSSIPAMLPPQQHSDYRWMNKWELLGHPEVHANTKAYFGAEDSASGALHADVSQPVESGGRR